MEEADAVDLTAGMHPQVNVVVLYGRYPVGVARCERCGAAIPILPEGGHCNFCLCRYSATAEQRGQSRVLWHVAAEGN